MLSTVNMALFGNRVFKNVIKMKSYHIRLCPKSNDWCLPKRKVGRTHTDEASHVTTEAEVGVMQLQARHCQGFLATTRRNQEGAREDSSLEPSQGAWLSLNFGLWALNCKRNTSLWKFFIVALGNLIPVSSPPPPPAFVYILHLVIKNDFSVLKNKTTLTVFK